MNSRSRLTIRFELLVSVKGIAKASAIALLAAVLPADMTTRQWEAHEHPIRQGPELLWPQLAPGNLSRNVAQPPGTFPEMSPTTL